MTEKEWMEATSPVPLLIHLRGPVGSVTLPPPRLFSSWGDVFMGTPKYATTRQIARFSIECLKSTEPFPFNQTSIEGIRLARAHEAGEINLDEFHHEMQQLADSARPAFLPGLVFIGDLEYFLEPFGAAGVSTGVAGFVAWQLAGDVARERYPHYEYRDGDVVYWILGLPPGSGADVEELRAAFDAEWLIHANILREIVGSPFRPVVIDSRWLTTNVLVLALTIDSEEAFDRMPILADALLDAGCDNDDVLDHCRSTNCHVRGCWVVDLLLGR